MNRNIIGRSGENQIIRYLIDQGWTILERNFRYQRKEVDIIAQKNDLIIFVEVKTRQSRKFGRGMEAIDQLKRNNIIFVARYYIEKNHMHNCDFRFDVASVDYDSFTYIENAFQIE